MYLFMALFWLVVGVLFQVYWTALQPRANIPVDRTTLGIICFVMFSYCFIRWRMVRMMQRAREEPEPPPRRHRAEHPIDPTFDFSDPKPGGADEQKPPA